MQRKSVFIFILIGTIVAILSGCEVLNEWRDAILQKTNSAAEKIGFQMETTKINVENKAEQVQDAAKKVEDAAKQLKEATRKVKEAADAVKKVGQ